jgi:hypothetical protein
MWQYESPASWREMSNARAGRQCAAHQGSAPAKAARVATRNHHKSSAEFASVFSASQARSKSQPFAFYCFTDIHTSSMIIGIGQVHNTCGSCANQRRCVIPLHFACDAAIADR